jgi:hypothetical protein
MSRKLKTYQTSQGFFDLASSVPSMKAALEGWGSTTNLFYKGFAEKGIRKEAATKVKKRERLTSLNCGTRSAPCAVVAHA